MLRILVFYLNEKDHEWLERELDSLNGVGLLGYGPIENQDECYCCAILNVTSSSSLYEFMEKHSLWDRLFFYEHKRIVPISESKYLGASNH